MKIKDLILAASAAAAKDYRYYLNGVLITAAAVTASDGAKFVRIAREDADPLPDDLTQIIIPIEAVKSFYKKFTKKEHEARFEIVKLSDSYALKSATTTELFEPVAHKYPDFSKLLQNVKELKHNENADTQFNCEIQAVAQKALNVYYGTKNRAYYFYRREKFGYFRTDDVVHYVVMPLNN